MATVDYRLVRLIVDKLERVCLAIPLDEPPVSDLQHQVRSQAREDQGHAVTLPVSSPGVQDHLAPGIGAR
jgi:hypothetical protein